MSRFTYVAPERLQFREGGGCLSIFGVPFFGAGIFLLLTAGGALPMGDPGDLGDWGRPLLGLMGVVFTAVGGGLVFGRAWTVLDRTEQAAIKSWGLLVPMHETPRRFAEFTRVTIGFEPGDSDTAEKFPVALKARSGPDLVLCAPTAYQEARAFAAEAAKHIGFSLEDATGSHSVAIDPADADRPLQRRPSRGTPASPLPVRPAAARSEVHHETTGVRLVIPHSAVSPLGLLFVLVPIGILAAFGPPLWSFFEQTRTPTLVGAWFLAMLVVMFGVLPTMAAANGYLRARWGYVEVTVTRDGVTVRERGAWRSHTLATLDAADILDVDFGTRDTASASARSAVEQKLMQAGHKPASLSPRMEWLMAAGERWAKGRGVIVKTRGGLTTFGGELDDDEIRYLHAVVRRALLERT